MFFQMLGRTALKAGENMTSFQNQGSVLYWFDTAQCVPVLLSNPRRNRGKCSAAFHIVRDLRTTR